MFYIYHIKGVKVGCTNDLKKRVEQTQGYNNYEILASTDNIKHASKLEIHFQQVFNYKQDKNSYLQLMINKNKKIMTKMIHVTERTLTFKGTEDKELTGYKFPMLVELLNGNHIEFDNKTINWILENNASSQHNKERFIYIEALLNFLNVGKYNEIEIFSNIRTWAEQKGIFEKGDVKTQYIKLQEEAGELAKALLNNDKEEIIDAIGDCVVVLTNLSKLAGYNIEDCINSAYNVISKRTGKMENGTFIKDK
jgi:NTP pyrophosphatase (non-canonical NTP hydrolase)